MTIISPGRGSDFRLAQDAVRNRENSAPIDTAALLSEVTDLCINGDRPDDRPGTARSAIRKIFFRARAAIEKPELNDEDRINLDTIIEMCTHKLNLTLKPMGAAAMQCPPPPIIWRRVV